MRSASTLVVLIVAALACAPCMAPAAVVISVKYVVGTNIPVSGDTTLTDGPMENALGNTFMGQIGMWNPLGIGTYNQNSAISDFLTDGYGGETTVKLALGRATGLDPVPAGDWRCNPNESTLVTLTDLRSDEAYLYNGVITGDHYVWAFTGLQPDAAYKLTFFGDLGNAGGASNVANGMAATYDSEGDWNWDSVIADTNGTISGVFTAPYPTLGIFGAQIIQAPKPIISITDGGWDTGDTWDLNPITPINPPSDWDVFVRHTVTYAEVGQTVSSLNLDAAASDLTLGIGSSLASGIVAVSDGSLNVQGTLTTNKLNITGGTTTIAAGSASAITIVAVSAGLATLNDGTIGTVDVSGTGQLALGGTVGSLNVTGGMATIGTTGVATKASVTGGQLDLNGSVSLSLAVDGGLVNTGAGASVRSAYIKSGSVNTGSNDLLVTEVLTAYQPNGMFTATYSGGSGSFGVRGDNLTNQIDKLTLSGDKVTLARDFGASAGLQQGKFSNVNSPIDLTTPNPNNLSPVLYPVAGHGFGDQNTTVVYTGQILTGSNGTLNFGADFDDSVAIKVGDTWVLNNPDWEPDYSSGTLTFAPNTWVDFEIRFLNRSGGGGPAGSYWKIGTGAGYSWTFDGPAGTTNPNPAPGDPDFANASHYQEIRDSGQMSLVRYGATVAAIDSPSMAVDVAQSTELALPAVGTSTLGDLTLLASSTLTLSGTPGVSFNNIIGDGGTVVTNGGSMDIALTLRNGNGTFSGAISDGVTNKISLVNDGPGTLILAGVNTYSGSTTVSNGMLQVNATGSINNTSAITVDSAGTLDVSQQASTYTLGSGKTVTVNGTVIGSLAVGDGAVLTGTGSLIGSAPSQSVTVDGTVSPGTYGEDPATEGVGTLTVGDLSNDVDLHLGATSVYNWGLSPAGQGLISVTGAVTVAEGATVCLNNGGQDPAGNHTILTWTSDTAPERVPGISYAPAPSGTEVHWIGGATGNWQTGENWDLGAYDGGSITIDGKSFVLSGVSLVNMAPQSTSMVVIAPATGVEVTGPSAETTVKSLEIGNAGGTSASSLNLVPGVAFGVTNATTVHPNAGLTVNGTLTTASLTTSGQTTFASGATVNVNTLNVNGGMLKVADGGQLGTGDTGVTLGSGTLQLTGSAFNSSRPVTINGGEIDVPVTATISGPIGGAAPLTKTGAGTLIITGTNSFPSAAVNAGTLQGNVDSIKTDVALNAASANVTFDQPSDGAYKKVVSGDGSLTKAGDGIMTLSKTQAYGGGTVISGGTLKLQGSAGSPPVEDYARWFDASSLEGYSDGQAVTQWNDLSVNEKHATVPGGNANPTYIADAGTGSGLPALQFAKNGGASSSGALTFERDSSIRTVFSIFKGAAFLLTDQSEYHFHRADLGDTNPADPLWCNYTNGNITGGQTYVNGVLVSGLGATPTDLHNGYNLVEVLTNGGAVQADSFNKDRGGAHAGDQSHAEVIIYDRVLSEEERLAVEEYLNDKWFGGGGGGGSNLLPTTTAITMASGTTLDLNGVSQQIASLADADGGGSVINSNAAQSSTLTLSSDSDTPTTFSGVIVGGESYGTINLVKDGSGTQILSGNNTYTGDTTVKKGTLSITQLDSLADASTVTIFNNDTAYLDLAFEGMDKIAELYLGGVAKGPGVYGASSYPSYFTGTGRLLVGDILPGDANLDGIVDAADYIWLKQNFGMTGASPEYGDLDNNGTVDWGDLQILMGALNGTGAPAVNTPEPATLGLLAIGALAVIRRRRRA